MDHVNIARVFDGGANGNRPAVLRHGVGAWHPDHQVLRRKPSTPRERLLPAAGLPGHPARPQKGIIHRDIKPSNVMVTL
jgi:hypothetical protein